MRPICCLFQTEETKLANLKGYYSDFILRINKARVKIKAAETAASGLFVSNR